jgi:hypothetical protein
MAAEKKETKKSSPEQVSPKEALRRMKQFTARKEKFIAAVRKSKD